jgi:hypothetical protein
MIVFVSTFYSEAAMGGSPSYQDSDVVAKRGVHKVSKTADLLIEEAISLAKKHFGDTPDPAVQAAIIQALAVTHASMLQNSASF